MAFLKILPYVFPSTCIILSQTAETADNGCSIWRMCTLASTGFLLEKCKNRNGIVRRAVKGIPLSFQTHKISTLRLAGVKNKIWFLMLGVI